jgi:hypothetical protein
MCYIKNKVRNMQKKQLNIKEQRKIVEKERNKRKQVN